MHDNKYILYKQLVYIAYIYSSHRQLLYDYHDHHSSDGRGRCKQDTFYYMEGVLLAVVPLLVSSVLVIVPPIVWLESCR